MDFLGHKFRGYFVLLFTFTSLADAYFSRRWVQDNVNIFFIRMPSTWFRFVNDLYRLNTTRQTKVVIENRLIVFFRNALTCRERTVPWSSTYASNSALDVREARTSTL